jgi:hypothetical protein
MQQAHSTPQKVTLPSDPPVGTHGYGARMISLAIDLARDVGLRGAARSIKKFIAWLGVEQRTPDFSSIRTWMQRFGIAQMERPMERADDWVWMADHSNQIGPEKALAILAVRASEMPERGQTLRHEDVRTLTVIPGKTWKKEDVAEVFSDLANRYGAPRAILMDGAAELREGALSLKTRRSDTITLHDFKHKASNVFKALIGKDPRFIEFNTQLGRTRSAIQQTEIAFLTPPSLKQKARFMNLGPQLKWAMIVLELLNRPEAKVRQWVTPERLEEKLGWLREFTDDIASWWECQRVINVGLKLINTQGLFWGVGQQLQHELADVQHATSQKLAAQLIEFLTAAEEQLKEGERLPISTEILESSFALYKQLERQHSKGGFTSLLASFAALLTTPTPSLIRESLSRVSNADVKRWVKDKLGETLQAKRIATYRDLKYAVKSATKPKTAN